MFRRVALGLEVIVGFLILVSALQATVFAIEGIGGPATDPLQGTVLSFLPLLAVAYWTAGILMLVGLFIQHHNTLANGLLVAFFVCVYSIAVEVILMGLSLEYVDTAVLGVLASALYVYEKRLYRKENN